VVLIWDEADLHAVDQCARRALDGHAGLVVVHGGPGSGRTTFLSTAVERVRAAAVERGESFEWRPTAGDVSMAVPFRALRSWGLDVDPAENATPLDAERLFRDWIGNHVEAGPLLITADDLQWLDPESVGALARVLESAEAERLLVLVTVGHFEPFQHVSWQRLVASDPIAHVIELSGLPLESAATVSRDIRPDVSSALVQRLWEHTQGNPLFLTSLLRRFETASLERMVQFPAPDEYARAIEVRLATLGHDAITLARAASVIGTGWMTLVDAASVAQMDDAASALDILVTEFILFQRADEGGTSIQMVHAVIRASIYQHIPATERITFHSRAADVAEDELSELGHRFAAAATHDDALAGRLERAADHEHESGAHRLSAQYLSWASQITSDSFERSRRWLGSLYESILAGNVDSVRDQLPAVRRARDSRSGAVVEGTIFVLDNEWLRAVDVLRPAVAASDTDDLVSYRLRVLLAWSSMVAGEPTVMSLEPLESAETLSRRDDALAGLATITSAMLDRRKDRVKQIQERLGRLPRRAAAVPMDDTYWLAWRGFSAVLYGRVRDAIVPLSEVDSRMATGMMNVGDGLSHAFMGFGYWLSGAPELAAIQYRKAEKLLRPRANAMTAAYISFGYISRGDNEHAARLLSTARSTLLETPWDEAVNVVLMASVANLYATGTADDRAALLPGLRHDFGRKADKPYGAVSPMWKVHAALAHIWAGETPEAESLVDGVETTPDLAWSPGTTAWLRGLIAEQRGEHQLALTLLRRASVAGTGPLLIFEGHVAADLARLETAEGAYAAAAAATARSRDLYMNVGAVAYAANVPDFRPPDVAVTTSRKSRGRVHEHATAPEDLAGLGALSERERDVAALLSRGMSYAQIGRELFITTSTVSFHLTRIYAKTGTSTRHELSELIRHQGPLIAAAESRGG
jgi:DNA-binding CsgD family transcriptional regulator